MITQERLKELIEQGATIYGVDYGRILMADIVEIKTKDMRYSASNDNFQYIYKESGDCYLYEFNEENLFETKEYAEWQAEFGCIERVERLVLPTWEEVYETVNRNMFYFEKGIIGKINGTRYPNFDEREIEIKNIYLDNILFKKPLTKENYIEACRKAKELFLEVKQ